MLATDMLRSHHDHIRDLVRSISAAGAAESDRERRGGLLDELAGELSLHEQIEDELFYPAMRNVSTLVTISHAEHRELDDQVAVVLRVSDDADRFAVEFAALVAGFEHHAQLEEREMFPEAEAKVDNDTLMRLGQQLEQRLNALHSSKLTGIRLSAKRALLRRL